MKDVSEQFTPDAAPETRSLSPKPRHRRWSRPILLGLTVALLAVPAGKWLYHRSQVVATDDARIASNIISISSKLPGLISSLPVTDGQQVDTNSLLVQIDPRSAHLELDSFELKIIAKQAAIERAQEQSHLTADSAPERVKVQQAQLESATAGLAKAESERQLAQANFNRAETLRQKRLLSIQDWEQQRLGLQVAERSYQQAQADLRKREAELGSARAALRQQSIDEHSIRVLQQELAQLKVEREHVQQTLDDHQVRSPIGGIIDRTFVHAGEFVLPGKRLVMLHDPNDIWVSANVKETELRHIQPGAKARVWIDSYPDQVFEAEVERIEQATTSEFALLPNPNPSGNFTKVTQRVTVRLAISQQQQLLKPGMMVEVEIDAKG